MKKETYPRNTDDWDVSLEAPDDFDGPVLNAPKRSPMRRKEKFRTKDFRSDKEQKDRKRNYRNKIKFDSRFWEE